MRFLQMGSSWTEESKRTDRRRRQREADRRRRSRQQRADRIVHPVRTARRRLFW
jgi:hypothetical protein